MKTITMTLRLIVQVHDDYECAQASKVANAVERCHPDIKQVTITEMTHPQPANFADLFKDEDDI